MIILYPTLYMLLPNINFICASIFSSLLLSHKATLFLSSHTINKCCLHYLSASVYLRPSVCCLLSLRLIYIYKLVVVQWGEAEANSEHMMDCRNHAAAEAVVSPIDEYLRQIPSSFLCAIFSILLESNKRLITTHGWMVHHKFMPSFFLPAI